MSVALSFAEAIKNRRERIAAKALDQAEYRKAERAAAAEAAGREDYKPRRWFRDGDVRKLARERDKAEQESVKRATGVRPYTQHDTEEARREAIRASNRAASQKRRDRAKLAPIS